MKIVVKLQLIVYKRSQENNSNMTVVHIFFVFSALSKILPHSKTIENPRKLLVFGKKNF